VAAREAAWEAGEKVAGWAAAATAEETAVAAQTAAETAVEAATAEETVVVAPTAVETAVEAVPGKLRLGQRRW
jgi:hypothetical protein